ncbi:MAG TPA: hypothetical protein VJT71_06600 [Pyrinomonadaceae bacterium]|nr:hypothetical protein [Pyrinomonadaceae bacterium]
MLDAVFVIAGITAVVTAPFLFTRWLTPKFVFGIATIVALLVGASSTSIAQFQVQRLLQSAPSDSKVLVNGVPAQNAPEMLKTLKELRDLPAHHSSPGHQISVDIYGSSHIRLLLARDSSNPREYWVLYPKHFITRSNEIGRIITPLFDAY